MKNKTPKSARLLIKAKAHYQKFRETKDPTTRIYHYGRYAFFYGRSLEARLSE